MDKLTIVAHDRFQEIIEAANRPDSIIRKENIITIDVEELGQPKEIIVAVSRIEKQFAEEQEEIAAIGPPEEKQKAQVTLDAKKALFSILPELNVGISGIQDLKKDEIKQIAVEKLKAQIYSTPSRSCLPRRSSKRPGMLTSRPWKNSPIEPSRFPEPRSSNAAMSNQASTILTWIRKISITNRFRRRSWSKAPRAGGQPGYRHRQRADRHRRAGSNHRQ